MSIRHTFIYLVTAVSLLTSCRSKEEMTFSMDPVENIEALWQIIDTRYCYVENKGIHWPAIHDEYVAKAKTLTKGDQMALFDLCAGMLDSLRDGHVNLYSSFDRSYNTAWYDTFPNNFNSTLQALYLHDYRIAGGLYYCTIDSGTIGYIYYPSFSSSVSSANIFWIFTTFKDCKGLIIDVRNNGGGDISNAYSLAAPFFIENQTVGFWQHKTGPGHNDFSEMEAMSLDSALSANKWLRPVAVLCNRHSYSAANFFVSIMRYAPQAKLIGGISGGGGGIPMSYEIPCGWTVRFSSVRMYDRNKNDIEQGIEPDILITMKSTDKDDIIERAVTWIKEKK